MPWDTTFNGQDERPGSQWVPQQVRFYNQAYNYSFGSPTYGSPRDSVHCPSPPATDIFAPPSVATQAGAIGWLYQEGVTGGCGSFFDNPATTARYCPLGIVTRGEMASFLNRYLSLPNTSTNYFTDISTSVHKQAINNIRAAGITGGCTVTTYCPNTQVTRAQMASFLDRALDLPNTLNDYFTDDNSSPHEQDINNIRAAGITSGCTATTFCPNALVTRGEMAVFLYNGRNLRP